MAADPPGGQKELVRQAISLDISDDGIAGTHPITAEFPKPVATSQPGQKEHNTIKDFLVVVGCALFPDLTFAFDSSMVAPEISEATKKLARLRLALKDFEGLRDGEEKVFPPLALFGHADPVGKLDYNSRLSQRRASAVYGMLLRDVAIWEALFNDRSLAGDIWGDEEFGIMLDVVGFPPELPPGSAENDETRRAVLRRLKAPGGAGARGALFQAYMDAVCVDEDERGISLPFKLAKTDFLARGAHRDAKGDVQGCGEFNPVFLQAQKDIDRFERLPASSPEKDILKTVRNAANQRNRRVMAFLFKPGSRVDPARWPCPHRNQRDAVSVCRRRFWSNGPDRMKPAADAEREFRKTQDTFACRFYHGFAQNSPCEGILKLWVVRVALDDSLVTDDAGQLQRDAKERTKQARPIAGRRYVATMGTAAGAPIIRGRTDDNGGVRLPVFDEKTTITLRIDAQASLLDPKKGAAQTERTPESKFTKITLDAGGVVPLDLDNLESPQARLGIGQRLFNLGYGRNRRPEEWTDADRKAALNSFQRVRKFRETDTPDRSTAATLVTFHGS